jgi:hypothetical protein
VGGAFASVVLAAALSCALASGASGATVVATTNSVSAAMPNPGGTRIITTVAPRGRVTDVDLSIRLNHNFDRDIIVALRAPNGAYVTLANSRPGDASNATPDNYGSGATSCSGTQTTFNDQAALKLTSAVPPFAGSFVPENPLATLNGSPSNGRWETYLFDTNGIGVGTAAGTLYCASLVINYTPVKKKKKKKKK